MLTWQVLVLFTALLCGISGLELPPDFQICKRSGSDLGKCLKSAVQGALPLLELGLPPEFHFPKVNPLIIPSMSIGEGKGTVHVVQNFKNVNIYGITHGIIDNANAIITSTGMTITMNATFPELKIDADYDLNGRILILPISGNGKCTITYKDTTAHLTIITETFKKKGEDYMEVKTLTVKLNPTKLAFNFENLFNGDERLGKEMNAVLNENWQGIWEDVQTGYEEALGIILADICNKIFPNVPLNKLFP